MRESVANVLVSLDLLVDADVLDLFAGSGALGIEALSRGAAHATFVDKDRRALDAIRVNLDATGFTSCSEVVGADVERFLGDAVERGRRWDLALVDPPYAFDGWEALLASLPAAWVVVESDRELEPPRPWDVVRRKTYGGTVVFVARRELGATREPSVPAGETP